MPRRSAHTRAEIRDLAVSAAEKIVIREGYRGLNARKVAAAVGYAVGTLYLVFRNLDELVLEVNGRTLDRLYTELRQALADGKSARRHIVALGRAYIDFAGAHPRRWSLLYEHNLAEGTAVPSWYTEKLVRIFGLLEKELSALAAARSRAEIELAARTLWGSVHGICVLSSTNTLDVTGVKSMRALVDGLIDNYVKGFTAPV